MEKEKRGESCIEGHSPHVIGLSQMDIGFCWSASDSAGKV